VHALQNTFSCKIHLRREDRSDAGGGSDKGFERLRGRINEQLRKVCEDKEGDPDYQEVKIFCLIEVSNRFNAKCNTSYREYSYYLPSFTLSKISSQLYLGRKGLEGGEKEVPVKQEDILRTKVVNGVTIVDRMENAGDIRDGQEDYLERDITYLSQNSDFMTKLYGYRLSEERKQLVDQVFREKFEGTRKYHNFTRDMKPEQTAAMRFMLELSANDYMYVNQDTFQVTNQHDPRALEFVHFYLKGQSFLYN
jgi:tRNA U38,U39,U40 pseudouridine synthase TruA